MLKEVRTILSVIVIMALLFGSGLPFGVQPAAATDEGVLNLSPLEPSEKGNPKLDSQLNRLVSAETTRRAASFARESDIELVDDNNVRVVVEYLPGQLDAAIREAGNLGVVETSYRDRLQLTVPVSRLTALADIRGTRLVRLPHYPLAADVVSEGVGLINADDWQTAGYTGEGVKIAVLDLGFNGYDALLGTELPASVTTNSFITEGDITGRTGFLEDHGTACAEIVYDIAPGADLYLVNYSTDVEMGSAVEWLIDTAGVDIISSSVGWPIGGVGDGTGPICDMVDDAHSAGILWAQSMGNSAMRHWQGDFTDTDGNDYHEFNQDPNFDESNAIYAYVGDPIRVGLRWDDEWGASGNDYDLYLYDTGDGPPVASSNSTQDGSGFPTEFLSYSVPADSEGFYHIAIHSWYSDESAHFHLMSWLHFLQYPVASGSFVMPADSPNAVSVGAVAWNTPETLEYFSSQGPTDAPIIKPDLVATDNVSNTTINPFRGTSASAPHVAGAAALVKQLYPSYEADDIKSFLEANAVEIGGDGKDNLYGSGLLYLGSPPGLTPPEVTTIAATDIAETSATLRGNLESLGDYGSANVSFEWGTESEVYTDTTAPEAMTSTGAFSANLSSLSSATTYYFRAKGVANGTVVYGEEVSFPTPAPPPPFFVTTSDATNITNSSATLNGYLTIDTASMVNVSFEWGTTPGDLTKETTPEAMTTSGPFSFNLTGLSSNTTYYFSAKGDDNITTTVHGQELTFTPGKTSPVVTTNLATNITTSNATLNMSYNFQDYGPGSVQFAYKQNSDSTWTYTSWVAKSGSGSYFETVTSLSSDTLYDFKARLKYDTTEIEGSKEQFTTENLPPSAPVVNVTPDAPATGDDLVCTVTTESTDPNGDPVTYTYEWYKNDALQSDETTTDTTNLTDTVSSTLTAAGEIWKCVVTPNDGITDGTSGQDQVTIGNTAPVLSSGSVTPSTGNVTTEFTYTVTYTDADNDPPNSPTVTIDSGAPQPMAVKDGEDGDYANGEIYEYTTSGLTKDISHTFQFAASDGTDDATGDINVHEGLPVVQNTPPSAPVVNVTPDSPATYDDLVCTVTTESTDADSDTITYTYEWYKDDVLQPDETTTTNNLTDTVSSTLTARGETWKCVVTPNDETVNGTSDEDQVTIGNTPPTATVVNVTPDLPVTDDDLVCTVTTESNDPDGDTVTYTYEWYKDDVLQPDETTTTNNLTDTVSSILTAIGETWKCVVTPNDGTVNGTSDEDQVIIVAAAKSETITDDGTLDATAEADTEVVVNGSANVTVAEYADNPGTGFSGDIGKYVDVYIDDVTGVTEVEIRLYYTDDEISGKVESELKLQWWNGSAWADCSPTGVNPDAVNGYSGYIWALIRDDGTTTPTLAELSGTPFGAAAPDLPTSTTTVGGGGGGGGGGGLCGLISLSAYTTMEGRLFEDVTGMSCDKKVTLFLPKGTMTENRVGSLLPNIRIEEEEETPASPTDSTYIGLVYDIQPYGATFEPAITLTISYDASGLPQGVSEENLFVANWDESAGEWVKLESTVDLENDTVSAKISHLSVYTLLAYTRPASFTATDLLVTPEEVNLGESISASVFVTNTGDLTGSYEAIFEIDGVLVQTREVTIGGGDSETVSFSVTPDTAGEHALSMCGLLGTCEVIAPEAEVPPTPSPASAPASFAISALSITPSEVRLAEQVTISALVTNTGGSEGSYTSVLKIDGVEEDRQEVTLGAGRSETVTFTIAKNTEGSYTVDINGEAGQFTVVVPTPLTPTPVEALPVQPETNWGLIGGIIAACIVVAAGLLAYFLVWRKRRATGSS